MELKKNAIIELTISDLAFGGSGVAKLGDLAVFVERAVPGDKILARLTRIKSSYAEAKLEKLVEASPERVSARCKHFGVCGGCSFQNLNYENQLKWKWKMVSDALARIGGFRDAKIEPIIGCESPWFYRNKMEYSFGASFQSKPLHDDDSQFSSIAPHPSPLSLGLHPSGNFREVFNLEECFLQSELSVKIARAVRQWAQENNLGAELLRNLIVREGKNTGEIMVNLVTHGSLPALPTGQAGGRQENFPLANDFKKWIVSAFPQITSLYCTAITVQRGKRTAVNEFHLAGKPHLTETLRIQTSPVILSGTPLSGTNPPSLTFEIAPQAFFQPNTLQAEILYGKILEFAEADADDIILDLFCGTGTIGLAFAGLAKQVFGIEINKSATESAKSNAALNKITNAEFICGDVGKLLPSISKVGRPTIIITDPPRAGIDQKTLLKILDLKIPKWIYVSCNPTTLARDLKIVGENGYKIKRIQPVDMFPHTYHVETVCLLETH
ncbi:MAG: 23S rRNA (uracil(1939)-C(5))-methyltransferase RlmD [Patescibacteria group bacterium]